MPEAKKAACQVEKIVIGRKDLPLCCPMPDMTLWNAHPRVYLPIKGKKQVKCPYCSTVYLLRESD